MSDAEQPTGPVAFRKVAKRRIEVRRREEPEIVEKEPKDSDDESDGDEASNSSGEANLIRPTKQTYMNSKRARKNPLAATSVRRSTAQKGDSSSSEEEERRRALDIDFKYSSSNTGESTGPKDLGATATTEIDTEHDKDYQAQCERVRKMLKDEESGLGTSDRKVYRGIKMYGAREATDSTKDKASSGLNRYGPLRAQQFMRANVRWDYAPDICKDYKETGFCTFGDSCKFLHDRSDYKHGWELENDWQKQQAEKKKQEEDYTIHSDDED